MDVDLALPESNTPTGMPNDNVVNVPLALPIFQKNVEQQIPPAQSPQLVTQSGRPCCDIRLPQCFRNNLPEPPMPACLTVDSATQSIRRVVLIASST